MQYYFRERRLTVMGRNTCHLHIQYDTMNKNITGESAEAEERDERGQKRYDETDVIHINRWPSNYPTLMIKLMDVFVRMRI